MPLDEKYLDRFNQLLMSQIGNVIPTISEQMILPSDIKNVYNEPESPSWNYSRKDIDSYKKNYPCIPKSGRFGAITEDKRDLLYKVFMWLRTNKDLAKSTLGVTDDKTLLKLFKLAIIAGDRETGFGSKYDENENIGRSLALLKQRKPVIGGITYNVATRKAGNPPSLGQYALQPQNFEAQKGTHKLFGSNVEVLWENFLGATLSAMEYQWNLYLEAKKLGYSGPSVISPDGKVMQGGFGDWNWDAAFISYVFNKDKVITKYCRVKNPDGSINKQYCGLCSEKEHKITINGKTTVYPILQNQVVKNYIPCLNTNCWSRGWLEQINTVAPITFNSLSCLDKI